MIAILLALLQIGIAQAPWVYPRLLSKPKGTCDNEVRLVDARSATCHFENEDCEIMYPVFVEEFDNKEDLPNRWRFDLGFTHDDDVEGKCIKYSTWCGDGYNNITVSNSEVTIFTKQESAYGDPGNGCGPHNYGFTSAILKTLSHFRTGIFEARISLPDCIKMWPAYWLLYSSGHYAEIDIFEFMDKSISGSSSSCDQYYSMKMTLHGGTGNNNQCHRGDKFPVNANWFNTYHTYKLNWNDYTIKIYVDGLLKGIGYRYTKWQSVPMTNCFFNSSENSLDPLRNWSCQSIATSPGVNIFNQYVHLNEDTYWPTKEIPMDMILSNAINFKYKNDNFHPDFSQNSMNMRIDYAKVWQPICCTKDWNLCSVSDLENSSYKTMTLAGKSITVGNSSSTCNFIQSHPNPNDWSETPFVFLATDEIAFNSYIEFPGDRYVEARIINCNNGFKVDSSTIATEDSIIVASEMIQIDSLRAINPSYVDSIYQIDGDPRFAPNTLGQRMQNIESNYQLTSNNEAGEISISPNPTEDKIFINCSSQLYSMIDRITLINANGVGNEIETQLIIDISNYSKGLYLLRVQYKNGTISTFKTIKL